MVQHCFTSFDFKPLIDLPITLIENNVEQYVINGKLFLNIYDNVHYFNKNENYDSLLDEIVERSLQNKDDDYDNNYVQPAKITMRIAVKCIN